MFHFIMRASAQEWLRRFFSLAWMIALTVGGCWLRPPHRRAWRGFFAVIALAPVAALVVIGDGDAFAQTTPPGASIPASSIVGLVLPFVLAILTVVIRAAVQELIVELRKWNVLNVQQDAVDQLDAFIENKVGGEVATAAGNLATASIPLGSDLVAEIAKSVIAEAPDLLDKAGVTPDAVAGMVHGEIGKWQASMTRVAPPAAPAAATVATAS